MIKKLILLVCMLTSLSAIAGDLTKDEVLKELTDGLESYNKHINNKNWKDAELGADAINAVQDLNDTYPKAWSAALNDFKKQLQGLNFDNFILMLQIKAEVLRLIDEYNKNTRAQNWKASEENLDALDASLDLINDAPYKAVFLANLKPFINNMSFDAKYIGQLRADLKIAQTPKASAPSGSGSASSAKQPDAEKKKQAGAQAAAAKGAITPITDKAEFDLVVQALNQVFKAAEAADKSILAEIEAKKATKEKLIKEKLINAGDQIKPVIGQVKGPNTTFNRAEVSATAIGATDEQKAQLKAIRDAIGNEKKGFIADIAVIDAAAAAA